MSNGVRECLLTDIVAKTHPPRFMICVVGLLDALSALGRMEYFISLLTFSMSFSHICPPFPSPCRCLFGLVPQATIDRSLIAWVLGGPISFLHLNENVIISRYVRGHLRLALSNCIILLTFTIPVIVMYPRVLVTWLTIPPRGCLSCNASSLHDSFQRYQYRPYHSFTLRTRDFLFLPWCRHQSCSTITRDPLGGKMELCHLYINVQ